MARFRARTADGWEGRWLSSLELAEQDAVQAGRATRQPVSGCVRFGPGVLIETDGGFANPVSLDAMRLAEALLVIKEHDGAAESFAERQLELSIDQGEGKWRWRSVLRYIRMVLDDAAEGEPRIRF